MRWVSRMAVLVFAMFVLRSAGHAQRAEYAGDAACLACHKDQAGEYLRTAHHLTSQLPSRQSILGSFAKGEDTLTIADPVAGEPEPGLFFRMSVEDEGFFESAYTGFGSQLRRRKQRIDLVTGSGRRGQTYLYWEGDRLWELPVSYWTDGHRWINSPGYTDGTADFSRPVHPGCLECHATYLQPLSTNPATNRFDRGSLVTGVACESCHGPGGTHIALARSKQASKRTNEAILNPAKFSRDRQVDLCALCHNGIQREPLAPAFSYLPGKPLREFFKPMAETTVEHPDVHGDQVGLLQRSKCYSASPAMTCSTCHEVHAPEKAALYSEKCLSCHQWQSCGLAKSLGHRIASNCVDCHMPVEATTVIVSETAGKEVHATMRNHWIKVYAGAHLP